jgi:hypothetical protein
MELYIVGGDGGIAYSDLSATKLAKKFQEDEGDFQDEFWEEGKTHSDFIPEIKSCRYEAEYYPPMDESELAETEYLEEPELELRWIRVATCTDLGNYDYY